MCTLRALHVELGPLLLVGKVQGEQLDAHQVVAGGDAVEPIELVPAVIGDDSIDGPLAVAQEPNLEPQQACRRVLLPWQGRP